MRIGPHTIGEGRCWIVAEIGVNHNGSLVTALELIDAAAHAGADAVKFQTFRAEELGCSPEIAACEMPPEAWPVLALHAAAKGVTFFSTPFDCESADLLDPLVPCFKIASGEITNGRLLRHVGKKRKPVILSTGMADEAEIIRAIGFLDAGDKLALLHCVSAYPAPPEQMNLRAIETLPFLIDPGPVGLSDHTYGITIPVAAVAMGADIIEKHLTLNPWSAGPDQHMSTTRQTFADMVKAIRLVEAAMGDGAIGCQPCEKEMRARARRNPVTGRRP